MVAAQHRAVWLRQPGPGHWPLLPRSGAAAAQELRPGRGAHNPTPLDAHYDALRTAMRGVFHELGIAA